MIDMIPEMTSLKDASQRTGLSYTSLRKMCNEGKCPHIRIGEGRNASIKINLSAVCRMLNGEEGFDNA